MRVKYTAKWGLQIAEMIFQTRSSMDRYKIGFGTLSLIMERYHAGGIPIEELQMMPPKEVELLFYPHANVYEMFCEQGEICILLTSGKLYNE